VNTSTIVGLVNNAALLGALVLLYDMVGYRPEGGNRASRQAVTGLILGAIGVAVMLTPWQFTPGVVFDTRSVLLCVSGLFFGALPTLFATLMTGAFRLYTGGTGAWTGVAVIFTSGGIGLAWRHLRHRHLAEMSVGELYVMGLVVHMAMLLWMFSLPCPLALNLLSKISLPVVVIYPAGTAVLGWLMVNRGARKRAEVALQETKERLIAAQRIAKMGDFTLEVETGKVTWSDALFGLLQYDKSKEIDYAKVNAEIHHPDDLDRVSQWLNDCVASGKEVLSPNEYRLIRKDGETLYVRTLGVIKREQGKFPKIFATVQDITEHKRSEKALREAVLRQQEAVRAANVGLWDWDLVTNQVHYSAEWKRQIGYEEHEIGNDFEEWRSRVHPDDLKPALERVQKSIENKRQNHHVEFRFRHRDGSYRWILSQASVIPDETSGQPIKMIGSHIDITERKQAELELSITEARLRELMENMSSAVAVYEARENGSEFIFKDFNRAAQRIEQVNKKDVIGKSVVEVFPAVTDFGLFEVFQRVWRTGKAEHFPASFYQDERIVGWRDNYIYKLPSGELVAVYDDITKRKTAEEALQESERKYSQLVQESPDPIVSLDNTGRFISFNPAAERVSGFREEEVLGGHFAELGILGRESIPKALEEFDSVAQGAERAPFELTIIHKDKTQRFMEANPRLIRSKGENPHVQVVLRDVTDRVQARKALTESEKRFRALFEGAAEGILLANVKSKQFRYANPAICRMLGYSEEELTAMAIADIHPKEALPLVRSKFDAQVRGEMGLAEELPCVRKDGRLIYVNISPAAVSIGGEIYNAGFFTDVTKRREAQEKLREQLAFVETLLDTIPTPVFYKDTDGVYLGCNKAFEDFVGMPKAAIRGKTVHDIGPKEIADEYYRKDQELFQNPGQQSYEWRVKGKDGDTRNVVFNKSTFADPQGNVAGLVGVISDITARVQSEEKIRNLAKFPEENPNPIMRMARDGTVLYGNRTGERLLEAIGCGIGRAAPQEWCRWVAGALASGSLVEHEVQHNTQTFSFALAPVAEGGYVNWYGTNITDRKKTEEDLRSSFHEREVLLREVHHRVKNNLQVINSLLRLEARQLDDEHLREALTDCQNRIIAMALLHQTLYGMADVAHVDFAEYIRTVGRQLYRAYGVNPNRILLEVTAKDVALSLEKATPCGQIVTELLSNSLKYAFPEGWEGKGRLGVYLHRIDGGMVEAVVRDNGIGMPRDFDVSSSQSLGLHLVTMLAEDQLQGVVEWQWGKGTCVRIRFPGG
jgi:hypothetical protein